MAFLISNKGVTVMCLTYFPISRLPYHCIVFWKQYIIRILVSGVPATILLFVFYWISVWNFWSLIFRFPNFKFCCICTYSIFYGLRTSRVYVCMKHIIIIIIIFDSSHFQSEVVIEALTHRPMARWSAFW